MRFSNPLNALGSLLIFGGPISGHLRDLRPSQHTLDAKSSATPLVNGVFSSSYSLVTTFYMYPDPTPIVHAIVLLSFFAYSPHADAVEPTSKAETAPSYAAYSFQPESNWIAVKNVNSDDNSPIFCFWGDQNQKSFTWSPENGATSLVTNCNPYKDKSKWKEAAEFPTFEDSPKTSASIFGDGTINYQQDQSPCLINFATRFTSSTATPAADGSSEQRQFYIITKLPKNIEYSEQYTDENGCKPGQVSQSYDGSGIVSIIPINAHKAIIDVSVRTGSSKNPIVDFLISLTEIPSRVVQFGKNTPVAWIVPADVANLQPDDTAHARYEKILRSLKRADRITADTMTLPLSSPK